MERNGAYLKTWYECPNCHCYIQYLPLFLAHVDSHSALKVSSESTQAPHSLIGTIAGPEDAQLYIPKITITPLTEYGKYYRKFATDLRISLTQLTDQAITSIKSNLSRVQTRSSLRPQGKTYQVGNCDIDDGSTHPENVLHTISKKRKIRKPSAPCEICSKILSSTEALKKHVKTHDKNIELYQCQTCRKLFSREEDLTTHNNFHQKMEEKQKLKTFECKVCKSRFMHKQNLLRHIIKHMDNNPFRCKVCGLNSISRYHLQRHYALHFDQDNHECNICGVNFSRIEGFRRHMLNIHSVTSNPAFRRKIRKHKKKLDRIPAPGTCTSTANQIHVDQGTWKVKIEDDSKSHKNRNGSTPAKDSLAVHNIPDIPGLLREDTFLSISELDPNLNFSRYSTSGVLNAFPCKLCPSVAFSRYFALKFHMKTIHAEEYANENKPKALSLICMECGQACPSTQELSTHMESVHGKSLPSVTGPATEWIRCTQCKCRCKGKTALNRHINIMHKYPGQLKYTCQMCNKKYATLRQLRNHRYKYCNHESEGVEKPKCPDCGRVVANEKLLKSHRRLHDPNRKLSICKLCNEQCSCVQSLKRHIRIVHGNGVYRRNKGKKQKIKIQQPIPDDQLFL